MLRRKVKGLVVLWLAILMVFSSVFTSVAFAEPVSKVPAASLDKVDAKVYQKLKDEGDVSLIIMLKDQIDAEKVTKEAKKKADSKKLLALESKHNVRSEVLTELKANAHTTQSRLLDFLTEEKQKGKVKTFKSYYILNAVTVTAAKESIEKIALLDEVDKIYLDEVHQLTPEKEPVESKLDEQIEWNVKQVGAPEAWDMGFDGEGTVVATIDSGVQWDHPALKEKYRGYDQAGGSVEHAYSFFDAVNGQIEGYDDNGHGTHVTGTMVGSEPDGKNQIGVAPGAQWIAAKAFDSAGRGADSNILEAAQWILAPGGRVDMAPDVVNNSWSGGSGMDEWFLEVVQTWRAMEIVPVFAAGNASIFTPNGPGTIASPANYPDSFAVGATDDENKLGAFSFQGPSPYEEIKPEVTAPGVDIRSAVPGSGYEEGWDGTSMAAPHIAAAAAILRQANASITVDEIEEILTETATSLTDADFPASPNNGYGHGLLNMVDAVIAATVGMGTIKGSVTVAGEDREQPAIEHTPIAEADEGVQIDLTMRASDNVSVQSVELKYQVNDGSWKTVPAERTSGNYLNGEYKAGIEAGETKSGRLSYQWAVTDFVGNEGLSAEYAVTIKKGITIGFFDDFETEPEGWTVVGQKPETNWEWGVPTSGPNSAASGEKVYATNLDGNYTNGMKEMLVMPAIHISSEQAYLRFKQWHSFEVSAATGTAYDYGYVMVSPNGQDWQEVAQVTGDSNGWVNAEIDLSAYTGKGLYVAFYTYSDFSANRPGWYLDDVGIFADSIAAGTNSLEEIKQTAASGEPTAVEAETAQTLLPLDAHVSVVETGRSTVTDPQNGGFTLMHPAGEWTVVAESYGHHPQKKTVQVAKKQATAVDFTLEKKAIGKVTGKVVNKLTGKPVEGAKVYLVEDANIEPAVTDKQGAFTLAAFEGSYKLKVSHPMHYPSDAAITIKGNAESVQHLSMKPIIGYSETLAYDDGTAESLNYYHTVGNGWAVKMSLAEGEHSGVLTGGLFKFDGGSRPDPGGTEFQVEVFDASGPDGSPGKKIAGPFDAEAIRSHTDWTHVDLSGEEITVGREFYLAYIQKKPFPYNPAINKDSNGTWAGRSYSYIDGKWRQTVKSDGNYMIRATVAYDQAVPEITSPKEGVFTADRFISVEGEAQPNTKVYLYNKGVIASAVKTNGAGQFTAKVLLTSGENVLTAKADQGAALTRPSNAVTVLLDRDKPAISIQSPAKVDKLNTAAVTVKGKVQDKYLKTVTVQGTEVSVTNGAFEVPVELAQGLNTIKVSAQDFAGNEATAKAIVMVDSIAPEITIETPTDGERTDKKYISIKGTAADEHLAFVRVNGKIILVKKGVFSTTIKLEDGENIISILAKDTFGNETNKQVKVFYER